jgi:nucleoside-diphosphate-sugar epimerase
MKVLVTGASGFVGGYLVPALAGTGHEVFALVREPASYSAPAGVRPVVADLSVPLDLASLPQVDAVAHFAQSNVPFPDEAATLYRVNTSSTLDLLEHARRCRAQRFLYASSASVYGFGERPFTEDDPLSGRDLYAVTKMNSEQLVSAYGGFFATAVFRLVAPYGPGQTGRMIPGVIGRVRDGRPVTLNGGGRPRMNPIYVDDAVRAVVAALDLDGNHVLNVAGDEVVGIDDIAERAGEALGREPIFEEGEPGSPGDVVADTERFHELIGLGELVSIREGIRSMVAVETETPA